MHHALRRYPSSKSRRAHQIDYRHVITSLIRKPGAFRGLRYRDALHPSAVFVAAWQRIDAEQAPRLYLEFLRLAAIHGEEPVERYLRNVLLQDAPLNPHACERILNCQQHPGDTVVATVSVNHATPQSYDVLLRPGCTQQQEARP